MSLLNIFKGIFSKKKLVYSAFGNDNYYRIISKLKSNGVKYSIKTNIDYGHKRDFINSKYIQYDIYVREEDEQKAIEAIHKK